MIRTLIADDHQIFREGLAELLGSQRLVKVVGFASNGAEALTKVNALSPDLLILDISMSILDGLEVLQNLRRQGLQLKVLMLSMHNDAHTIRRAMQAGADGYILKEEAYEALDSAISEVMAGNRFLSPMASQALNIPPVLDETRALSPREREIVSLIAEGKSSREISTALGISVKTVETHRQRIMEKLDCHKATELVRYAIKEGILKQ